MKKSSKYCERYPENEYPPEIKTIRNTKTVFNGKKNMPKYPNNPNLPRKVKFL